MPPLVGGGIRSCWPPLAGSPFELLLICMLLLCPLPLLPGLKLRWLLLWPFVLLFADCCELGDSGEVDECTVFIPGGERNRGEDKERRGKDISQLIVIDRWVVAVNSVN